MVAFFSLSPLSAAEFAQQRGADDDEEQEEIAGEANGSGGGGASAARASHSAAAPPPIPRSSEALVEHLHRRLWSPPTAAATGSSEVEPTSPELAAVQTLYRALLGSASMIRATLRRPFLPDVAHVRPAHFPVLGTDTGVVAGVRVQVTIARAAPVVREGALPSAAVAAALRCADVDSLASAPPLLRLQDAAPLQAVAGVHYFTALDAALKDDAGAAACSVLSDWLDETHAAKSLAAAGAQLWQIS